MMAFRSFSRPSRAIVGVSAAVGLCVAGVLAQSGAPNWKTPTGKDFPLTGGNWSNQRYSMLDQINTTNIQRLGGVWMARVEDGLKEGFDRMEAAPVVVDGVMYISTGLQSVLAIDAKTGKIKWKYSPGSVLGAALSGNTRGVVVAEGKVFFGRRDNTLVALDQQTGAVAWEAKVTDQARARTSAPATYHGGLVYIGTAGGDAGGRGSVAAYEAKTGKLVWKFNTTPGPGERGSETWVGDSELYKHGGAGVWTVPAIDPDLGLIYFGTGNAMPAYDGSTREGDNLFTASVVALDLKTGAYKWHFQEVHHDLWDYDAASAPVLADVTYRGQPRKILMHAGKTGFLYLYDRTNGQPLIGIEERPVPQEPRLKTAKTQPFPVSGDAFVPQCADPIPGFYTGCLFSAYYDKPVMIQPGILGGNSFSPSTFSPKTNLIYIPASVLNYMFVVRSMTWNEERQIFQPTPGSVTASRPGGSPRSGTLTAMDPTTNKIVWQQKTRHLMGGGNGLLSTAGDLLFHGEGDGNFVARDIKNGEVLWRFQTGAGADAPPVTFEIEGEQYVAILAGGNSTFNLSERGDFLWAFKLGGTVPPVAAPPPPPATQPGQPATPATPPQPPAAGQGR